jgi:hypothetical protein
MPTWVHRLFDSLPGSSKDACLSSIFGREYHCALFQGWQKKIHLPSVS